MGTFRLILAPHPIVGYTADHATGRVQDVPIKGTIIQSIRHLLHPSTEVDICDVIYRPPQDTKALGHRDAWQIHPSPGSTVRIFYDHFFGD